MPEHSTEEDGSLTAEGQLFSYICSKTGRTYDLTEYVNDTNRQYTEVLTAYNINSGTDRESYTYAGQMRISKNRFWNEARDLDHDQMSYYLYDGRGSVTANTWYNGMVTAAYQYDPYGQMEHGSTKHTDFYGYNGESYNPNTGLVYLRARYYNAGQGRFFQEDTYAGTAADPLTQNRYAYVKNSPLNYIDPSGHKNEGLLKDPSNATPAPGASIPKHNSIVSFEEAMEMVGTAFSRLWEYMDIANTINHLLINSCYLLMKEEEAIRLAKLENLIGGDPKLYGKGWIKEQYKYSDQRGTFGIFGNVKDNGCGSIALHNVLRILGYANDYGELLMEMNRIWDMAMVFGGILGSNPIYIVKYLMQYADLDFTFYSYSNPDEADIISEDHTAYLNLYFYKVGAHYTASRFSAGNLQIYNDSPSKDYKTYFEKSGSEFMLVVGIDRL